MGSDVSHFNVLVGSDGQRHKTASTNQWHAKNPVPFYTQSNTNKKLTRIRLFDPYLCCMSCDCMFVCLPSWLIRLQTLMYFNYPQAHTVNWNTEKRHLQAQHQGRPETGSSSPREKLASVSIFPWVKRQDIGRPPQYVQTKCNSFQLSLKLHKLSSQRNKTWVFQNFTDGSASATRVSAKLSKNFKWVNSESDSHENVFAPFLTNWMIPQNNVI